MSYQNISKRKHDTFAFIKNYINNNGFAPTLAEIAREFDISRERAKHIVNALVADKKICKTNDACRNIELL